MQSLPLARARDGIVGRVASYEIRVRKLVEQETAVIYATLPRAEIGAWLQDAFARVAVYLDRKGAGPAGLPFARYRHADEGLVEIEAGFPASTPTNGEGEIEPSDLPGGLAVVTLHVGPYDAIESACRELRSWIRAFGSTPVGDAWEVYPGDPTLDHDLVTWRTEVVQPYRADVVS